MKLINRNCLADICNALNLTTAVEIGTHHAVFADLFMHRFRGRITLVDPWDTMAHECPTFYPTIKPTSENRQEDFEIACILMEKYGDRVSFMRETGSSAALKFADESVDFVYIDALHDFESVSSDIRTWFHKVRRGGIISGHDYHEEIGNGDVIRAVDNFFASHEKMQMHLTGERIPSWWAIKK